MDARGKLEEHKKAQEFLNAIAESNSRPFPAHCFRALLRNGARMAIDVKQRCIISMLYNHVKLSLRN